MCHDEMTQSVGVADCYRISMINGHSIAPETFVIYLVVVVIVFEAFHYVAYITLFGQSNRVTRSHVYCGRNRFELVSGGTCWTGEKDNDDDDEKAWNKVEVVP